MIDQNGKSGGKIAPAHLTTAKIEVLKPEAYILATKVDGECWKAKCLGHIDIGVAMLVAGQQKRMLLKGDKPFEVRLEKLTVVLHEVSITVN